MRWLSGHLAHALVLGLVWLGVSLASFVILLLNSSDTVVVASHDTVLRPTFSGEIVVHTGPVLPDLRMPTGRRIGIDLTLGKTEATSTQDLIDRYAIIASQPEGQIAKVETVVRDMAVSAALRAAAIGLLPVVVWLLVGRRRRRELGREMVSVRGLVVVALVLGLVVIAMEPWRRVDPVLADETAWSPLTEFVGVPLPDELSTVEVRTDVTTVQSRRLLQSMLDTYDRSKTWYAEAATEAADLVLHVPAEDETVVLLVSDRHDNIGMDSVARAIGDAGGATAVFSAGDETSDGRSWEAFSLDSLNEAFDGYDKFAVSGNHDHGDFVADYLEQRGWVNPDGGIVDGPGGSVLAGANDPRSSGLGNWRDETGLSFDDHAQAVADTVCESEERVTTLLVHDANSGDPALERGCVDLVIGGHTHVVDGPREVTGENGMIGYTYTTGSAGGAAYAIAVGSKPRRPAAVTLITYREGRPVGIQPVVLETNGVFTVRPYVELTY